MSGYGQFSPIAKAMEVLDERWTVLVVRELLAGSAHFNDLHRGVPRMSPALLSNRLKRLERAGVLIRTHDGHTPGYALTDRGRALAPVLESIRSWGAEWVGPLTDDDLDPRYVLWSLCQSVERTALPTGRTVLQVELTDLPRHERHHWTVMNPGSPPEVTDADPGCPVDALIACSVGTAVAMLRGELSWFDAAERGLVVVSGPAAVDVPRWLRMRTGAAVR